MSFDAGKIEATLDLDRGPFRRGLDEARKEAEAFEKRGIKLKVDVDKTFTGQIQRAINETQAKTGKGIRLPITVDEKVVTEVQDQLDRIGDATEATARRSGNRVARALLNPLVLQLGLIPGISAAAATAGALALGVLPVAFAAIAAAAVKSNETLQSSYSTMWDDIKTEAAEIADPLVDTFIEVSHEIFGTWRQLRPELAALFKDARPLILEFTDGVLGLAEEAVPRFRTAIQLSGPAMRGFSSLLRDTGAGLGEMSIAMAESSDDIGHSAELTGVMIRGLLRDVGELVAIFAGAWSDIGPKFTRVFDKMMDTVLGFTEGGLVGLNDGLNITLSVLEAVLNVLGPFADVFGQVGGYALAAVAAWKLMAGAMGLAIKLWNSVSPSAWIGKMTGVTTAITAASGSVVYWVGKMGASEQASERAGKVTEKLGNAVVKTAGSLPLLGTAFAVVKASIDHFWPSADTLADKIQRGGAAAAEARDQMYSVADGYNRGSMWAQAFAASSEDVRQAIEKQRAGLTRVERAQQDAAKAQRDYDYIVEQFGPNSKQAISASIELAGATDEVENAQHDAAEATQDHTDKIIAQTGILLAAVGARLGYQSSLLSMEQAQRNLADAIEQHGVGSLEARQADISYQQTILSAVTALGERVRAENASKTETEQNRLATLAMHQEIARLAVEAGTNLPPALAEMASKLTDAELAALGVTREVDSTGQSIYRLPPGKSLAFPNDAPAAEQAVRNLSGAIDAMKPTKWVDIFLNYIVTGDSGAAKQQFPGQLPGNVVTPGRRAKGGPVRQGMAYWVGEEGLPELFFPDVDGFVMNGRDSERVGSTQAGTAASPAPIMFGGDGASQTDPTAMIDVIAQALQRVFSELKLEIEGDQWATVVNKANLRAGAR